MERRCRAMRAVMESGREGAAVVGRTRRGVEMSDTENAEPQPEGPASGGKFFVDTTAPATAATARNGFDVFRRAWESQIGEALPLPPWEPTGSGQFRVRVRASKVHDTVISDVYGELMAGGTRGSSHRLEDRVLVPCDGTRRMALPLPTQPGRDRRAGWAVHRAPQRSSGPLRGGTAFDREGTDPAGHAPQRADPRPGDRRPGRLAGTTTALPDLSQGRGRSPGTLHDGAAALRVPGRQR